LKDLKSLLGDLVCKVEETHESKQIEEQLEKIRKEEGEQVKVDANFGKVQANAD
jgi:formylmethanofuran dehydrogenase subunit D